MWFLWVVSTGSLCGSPWVSAGSLHGSLHIVSMGGGDINQSKSVPMMSLNAVGNIDQSNFRCLCGSPWVVWWQRARQMGD